MTCVLNCGCTCGLCTGTSHTGRKTQRSAKHKIYCKSGYARNAQLHFGGSDTFLVWEMPVASGEPREPTCGYCWGSHGCNLPKGHEGKIHRCFEEGAEDPDCAEFDEEHNLVRNWLFDVFEDGTSQSLGWSEWSPTTPGFWVEPRSWEKERMSDDDECRCGKVHLGDGQIIGRSWNPDCPVHPWNERLQAQNDRAVEMQRLAAEARRKAREEKG